MEFKEKSVRAVNSPQDNKERTFFVHFLVESFCIVFQKYFLQQGFRLRFFLTLFLIFYQTSGSCSYKLFPIKKSVVWAMEAKFCSLAQLWSVIILFNLGSAC